MSANDGGGSRLVSLPDSLIAPLQELGALYKEYGSVPRAIFALISLYLVNGVLSIASFIVGSILAIGDYLAGSIRAVQLLVTNNTGAFGATLIRILELIQVEIFSLIRVAGPAGPPIVIAFAAVGTYLAYRIVVLVLGEIPVGSSIVDLLGLR